MPDTAHRGAFFWRTNDDGSREVSGRVYILIWVAPVLFLIAGAVMLGGAAYRHMATVPGEGEVVRVYEWEGETVFDRGAINYGPVFRYDWNGEMTEATSGMSSPEFNFDIGSRHQIRYFADQKANVVLPGPHNWRPGFVILGIGLATCLLALVAHLRLRRWLRGGA